VIAQIQSEHRSWVYHNFPDQQPHDPLLGLMEEVGELAHAHLKSTQGIRGLHNEILGHAEKIDAVGDIFIYLVSYCNSNAINLETAVWETWKKVKQRDWVANPSGEGFD
jgi:NTP pyrophosphatase (non-canonical NTP hydrolase)